MQKNKIQLELQPLEKEIISYQDTAELMEINSDEKYAEATKFIKEIDSKKKKIESLRKFFVDPLNKQVKDINAMFKPQVEQAENIITTVKKKMGSYFQEQEKARLKEEARLQAIRDKANEKRAEQGKEEISEPIRQVAEVKKSVITDEGKSTVRKVWKHKIISIDKLPEDVKKAIFAEAYTKGIIDTVIRKFVQAGVRDMSGVEIYEDTQIAIGK